MKPLLCLLLSLCLWQTAHAREISDEKLVLYCNAILLQDAGFSSDADSPADLLVRQSATKARHYFATLPVAQKKRELQRVVRLPLSPNALQGVAYVSALNGIEPYLNVRRMLGYESQPTHSRLLYPQVKSALESVFGNVHKIYALYPERRIALLLLEEHSDGAGAMVARSVRFRMLENQPRFILGLAMQSKKAFALLAYDFSFEAGEKNFRVLRRLCQDPNPVLRYGARQIRHRIHANHSRYKLSY